MPIAFTLTEMAGFTAESLGKPPKEYIAHHRMLRHWWAKGLLPAADLEGMSDSDPARFDLMTVIAVPVLCACSETGADVKALAQIYRAIKAEDAILPGLKDAWSDVQHALEKGKEPAPWYFHLWKSPKGFAGQWSNSEDDPRGPLAKRIMEDHEAVTGFSVVRSIVGVTPLLRALFNVMNGEVVMPAPKA